MIRRPRQALSALDTNIDTSDRLTSEPQLSKQVAPTDTLHVVAKFITINKRGNTDTIVISTTHIATIGRDPKCTYPIVNDISVSGVHCKLAAVESSTGGPIVSCVDRSTNGIYWNGRRVRKTSIILCHGDKIAIPGSQTFTCEYVDIGPVEKQHLFQSSQNEKLVGHYVVSSHCLGTGSFGSVHLAFDHYAHRQVACKTIKVSSKAHKVKDTEKILKEVSILQDLIHPGINRILDSIYDKENNFLHIILELACGGDLFTYITCYRRKEGCRVCEGEAEYIMLQLFEAVGYIHNRGIAHRDLKPENILLMDPGAYPRVMLADFGLARQKAHEFTLNVYGTVSYLPPEGIVALDDRRAGYLGMPSDCWSLGIIMYMMLAGSHPFDNPVHGVEYECGCPLHDDEYGKHDYTDEDCECYCGNIACSLRVGRTIRSPESLVDENTKHNIKHESVVFRKSVWEELPVARNLVEGLLEYNPADRTNIQRALRHHWIQRNIVDLANAYRERIGGPIRA